MRIENPVLKKELMTVLRAPKAYILLFVVVAAASAIALVAWPSKDTGPLAVGAGASVGRNFFGYLSFGILILITILTPALSAGVFTEEKEKLTHDLLVMTLMKPRSILLGKLFSIIGCMGIMVFATLPVFAIGFLIGGISLPDLFWVFAIFVVSMLIYALIGVNISLIARRTVNATVAALGIVFAYTCLLQVFGGLLRIGLFRLALPGSSLLSEVIYSILKGPFGALASLVAGAPTLTTGPSGPLAFILAACLPLYLIASRLVKRPVEPPGVKGTTVIREKVTPRRVRYRFLFPFQDPSGRFKPISDRMNPITARVIRHGLSGKRNVLIPMFLLALFIFTLFGSIGVLMGEASTGIWFAVSVASTLTLIVMPALSANIFNLDSAQGCEDALRMTLLDSRGIVMGKFLASFIFGLSIGLPAIGMCIVLLLTDALHAGGATLLAIGGILVLILFASVLGVFSAVITRGRVASIVVAYLLMFLFYCMGGPFIALSSFLYESPNEISIFLVWTGLIVLFALILLGILRYSIRLYERNRMQDR